MRKAGANVRLRSARIAALAPMMMVAAVATGVARAEQPVAGPLLQPLSQERLNSAATNKNDFLLAHGNYKQTRYHLADQINRSNVKNLKLAWSFATGVK